MPKKADTTKKTVSKKPADKKEVKKAAAVKDTVSVKKRGKTITRLRGFKDILPEEQKYWWFLRDVARKAALDYSFERIDMPLLEETDLFIRSVGKQTDIIEKEMFNFVDQGGSNVVLRPEATASAARAYINNGMISWPQPVKLFYIGPMFRYDRPQAGRLRQFHQFGFEVFGSDEPIMDAHTIIVAYHILQDVGIETTIQVNSIGTPETRAAYKVELVAYLRSHRAKLCDDCKKRLTKNPLRVLDCKEEGCASIRDEAPQLVDWLDEDSKNHFMKVLEYLDELEVPYVLNPHLVRGLDYYTRTVFEIWPAGDDETRAQSALGGGGRYDGLVETIGGQETPACGLAIGMERVISLMRKQDVKPPAPPVVDIFFAQLGEQARRHGMKVFHDFRKAGGMRLIEAFGKSALKPQLERANKLGVKYTLILGQKEVMEGTIIVRDMESGVQEIVDIKKVIPMMKKSLGIE